MQHDGSDTVDRGDDERRKSIKNLEMSTVCILKGLLLHRCDKMENEGTYGAIRTASASMKSVLA